MVAGRIDGEGLAGEKISIRPRSQFRRKENARVPPDIGRDPLISQQRSPEARDYGDGCLRRQPSCKGAHMLVLRAMAFKRKVEP